MSHAVLKGVFCALFLTSGVHASPGERAVAQMKDHGGQSLGTITLLETPQGVLLSGDLTHLTPGPHGFHVHGVGKCEPPFTSATGHFNPDGKKHGFHATSGSHAGDLPNLHASLDGKAVVDMMAQGLSLSGGPRSVIDQDGSAIVLHAKADDYTADPAGNSGDRIACGVITRMP